MVPLDTPLRLPWPTTVLWPIGNPIQSNHPNRSKPFVPDSKLKGSLLVGPVDHLSTPLACYHSRRNSHAHGDTNLYWHMRWLLHLSIQTTYCYECIQRFLCSSPDTTVAAMVAPLQVDVLAYTPSLVVQSIRCRTGSL